MSEQDRRAAHISNEDALRYFAEGARNRWHDHPATAFRGQQVFEMYRDILLRRLTAPDAPERGTASLRQLGRLKPLIVPDDFDAPDAPSGTVKEPNELEHEADSGMMFNVTTYVYPDQIARWMVTTSGLTRDEMITWVTSVYAAGSDPA
jgi:hypothetical protein